jgi:6-phosphogluconolactonase
MINKFPYSVLLNIKMAAILSCLLFFTHCSSTILERENTEQDAGDALQHDITTSTMVYIGTYAEATKESIFVLGLDVETGALTQVSGVKAGANPSYLTLDKKNRYLYAVNETEDYEGKHNGAVSAFAVDQQTGGLTLLNQIASKGGAPCFITLDKTGKTLLVANYMGGNITAFQLQHNGQISQVADLVQFSGSGPNKERQEAPHAHYVAPDPENRFVLAVDLGTDRVMSYRLIEGAEKDVLLKNKPVVAFITAAGAGPRHLTFHPGNTIAYLLNELNSTIDVLRYDADKGIFSGIQTIATLPSDFKENNQCAAIKVSADGRHLYASNRGHNSIVVYAVNERTGRLTLVEHINTGGDWPRDFSLDPTGKILLVANERSDNIVTFKRDTVSGKLTETGHQAKVSKPVCVRVVHSAT